MTCVKEHVRDEAQSFIFNYPIMVKLENLQFMWLKTESSTVIMSTQIKIKGIYREIREAFTEKFTGRGSPWLLQRNNKASNLTNIICTCTWPRYCKKNINNQTKNCILTHFFCFVIEQIHTIHLLLWLTHLHYTQKISGLISGDRNHWEGFVRKGIQPKNPPY